MSEDTGATLLVHPNAFAALDSKGRPAAAYPLEGLSGRDRYLGAEVDYARTKKIGLRVFLPAGFVRTKETTDAQIADAWLKAPAIAVDDTAYWRNAVHRGEVVPGDEATARAGRLPKDAPVGAAALAAAKAAAEARWAAMHPPAESAEHAPPPAAGRKTSKEITP